MPPRYDGTANPVEYLTLYTLAVTATRGNQNVLANWFVMGLKGTARTWLLDLPEGTIDSWAELCVQFVINFKEASKPPLERGDLRLVRQRPGKPLCKYIQRFSQAHNRIHKITDSEIIYAFMDGIINEKM